MMFATTTVTMMFVIQLLVAFVTIAMSRSNAVVHAYNAGLPWKKRTCHNRFFFQKNSVFPHTPNLQQHRQPQFGTCTMNHKNPHSCPCIVELKMSSSAPRNDSDDDEESSSSSSIRDQVLNLHCGKYNFEDPAMAMNAVGREFAQNLYSSSSSSSSLTTLDGADEQQAEKEEESWPNWAKRMVSTVPSTITATTTTTTTTTTASDTTMIIQGLPSITMQPQRGPNNTNKGHNEAAVWGASITIQNQFSTWEPYYSKIIQLTTCRSTNKDMEDGTTATLAVSVPFSAVSNTIGSPQQQQSSSLPQTIVFEIVGSSCGTLAPQGGTTNLCDANNPYSDSAQIHIRHNDVQSHHQKQQQPQSQDSLSSSWWCLAVGTEEDQWYYQLLLPTP